MMVLKVVNLPAFKPVLWIQIHMDSDPESKFRIWIQQKVKEHIKKL